MTFALFTVVGFVSMEAVSYATHRWLMHGVGRALHRSHHLDRPGLDRRGHGGTRWEANDLFPVMFSLIGVALFALATMGGIGWLLPVAVGVTAYGAAYLFVHDVYIHGRLPIRVPEHRYLVWVREAHHLHHRFGGEPYGMLVPVVSRELRERSARRDEMREARSRL